MRLTLAYVATCVVVVAGYRLYERLDIVEGEVAYATERVTTMEADVSELTDRVDNLEADAEDDNEDDAVDAMRFDAAVLHGRGGRP